MYKSGFNFRRMLLQQSLAGVQGGEPGVQGGESPSVITMQQNTRLVVLTLEVSMLSFLVGSSQICGVPRPCFACPAGLLLVCFSIQSITLL